MASGDARAILTEIAALLEAGHEDWMAAMIRDALAGGESVLEKFLVSNDLWGGAGSVADQALIDDKERRKELEGAQIRLGRLQMASGKTNERTEMWVTVFEKGLRTGLR